MTDAATLVDARRASPTVHTARRLGATLLELAGWFWAIALTAIVLGNLIGLLTHGSTDVSIAIYARQASIWFPFSLGIMLVATYLRVHLASGMTRRSFVRATVVVQVAAGAAYAAVLTALVLLERAAHDAVGWSSRMTEIQITDESSPAWAVFVDLAVPFAVANLSGLLVGVTYQRFGAWWGTLALPLTVGPVVVSQYVGGARLADLPGIWTTTEAGHLALAVGLGLAMGAVIVAAFAVIAQRLQLSPNP